MGTDKSLILSYLLDGKGGGQLMDWRQVGQWRESDGLLWVHLDYSCEHAIEWLKTESGLDELVVSALVSEDPRPRSTAMFDGLLVMMRGVNMNPGADPEDMVSIRMWVTNNRIITTRKRKLLSVSDMSSAIERGRGPASAGEFLSSFSEYLVDRMSDVVSAIDDKTDMLEDQVLTEKSYQLRTEVGELRREIISLRRYLSPQRESMTRLYSERVSWLTDMDRLHLREVADNTMRYIEDLDAAREKAIVIQEELMSSISEQMDKRMYVLSIISAVFLPLGFLTGLLGVNVGGIPGAENKGAFLVFCLMLAAVVVTQFVFFKKMKWM